MVRQGGFLHALAGVQARLLAIAGQSADQRRLAPGDRQLQHHAVEAVVLGRAGPDGGEGVLEGAFHLLENQMLAVLVVQLELVDIDAPPAGRGHRIAVLDHGLEAHVLQDRQHVGQGGRAARVVELEAELGLGVGGAAEGADAHRLALLQALQHGDVGQGLGGVVAFAIAGGEGLAVAGDHVGHLGGGAAGRAHGGGEAVFPGPGGGGDLGLDRLQARLQVLAGLDADDEVDPRQGAVGECGVIGRDPAAVGLGQDLAGALAQVGIVAVARHEHQHRDEAVERVAPLEQPYARPVVEVQYAQGRGQQVVFRSLEQLVARIGLQDVAQALFVVAAGGLAGALQHAGHLGADQRHLMGGLVIGLGGEEADEADLAGGPAVGAVPLDPDIVHVAAAMDARAQVGLGHRHRLGGQAGGDLGGEDGRLRGAAQHGAGRIAQHAQAVLRLEQRLLLGVAAVLQARIFVDARAQIDEVLVVQPARELQILGAHARRGLQLLDGAGHQGQHGREIVHRRADIGEGGLYALDQRRLAVGADAFQDDLDHRLPAGLALVLARALAVAGNLDDRVEHGADRQALVGDLAHHAVDQERRVVLQDLQPLQARRALHGGQAQHRGLALADGGEGPEVGQHRAQRLAGKLGEFVGGRVLGRLDDEGLGAGALARQAGEGRHEVALRRRQPGSLAHWKIPVAARAPPEERVRRRLAPPGGDRQSARGSQRRGLSPGPPWLRGAPE